MAASQMLQTQCDKQQMSHSTPNLKKPTVSLSVLHSLPLGHVKISDTFAGIL